MEWNFAKLKSCFSSRCIYSMYQVNSCLAALVFHQYLGTRLIFCNKYLHLYFFLWNWTIWKIIRRLDYTVNANISPRWCKKKKEIKYRETTTIKGKWNKRKIRKRKIEERSAIKTTNDPVVDSRLRLLRKTCTTAPGISTFEKQSLHPWCSFVVKSLPPPASCAI